MKYCFWFLLIFSHFVGQDKNRKTFVEAGTNISNIKISTSELTSLKLVSGNAFGYYIAVGKNYAISEAWSFNTKINISQTGGNIQNSAFFINQKLPDYLEKYKNAELKLSLYQTSIEGNFLYNTDKFQLYAGIQPSLIFYGIYKELGVKNIPNKGGNIGNPSNGGEKIKINTFSLRGQLGLLYPFHPKFFAIIGYHFGITDSASFRVSGLKIRANQDIFQFGIGYRL